MKFKKIASAFIVLLCLFSLVSCGASTKQYDSQISPEQYTNSNNYIPDSIKEEYNGSDIDSYTSKAEAEAAANENVFGSELTVNRKIVRNVSLSLETKLYEEAIAMINKLVEDNGGYLESSQTYGKSINSSDMSSRSANFTVRVPADKLYSFVLGIEAGGDTLNVINKNEQAQDITESYYDTESRLNSLLTQESRLLAMLDGATELQYMLEIENNLASVRYQIENYYSQLKLYDNQVSMSTVYINLSEVIEYKVFTEPPKTFLERISVAMSESWENFVIGLQNFTINFIYMIPVLILLFIIVLIIIFIIVVPRRRKQRRLAAAKEAEATVNIAEKDDKSNDK